MKRNEQRRRRKTGVPIFVFISMLITSVVICSGLAYHLVTTVRTRNLFREEIRNGIEVLANSARTRVVSLIVLDDYEKTNDVMTNTFGFNSNVREAFIVMKRDGRIYYDLNGDREGRRFSSGMIGRGLESQKSWIVPPAGVGIAATQQSPVAELVIGYSIPDALENQQIKALADFSKTVLDEITLLMDSEQLGQTRVFLVNLMLNNRRVSRIQLVTDNGVIFTDFSRANNGKPAPNPEGIRAGGRLSEMSKKVSVKKVFLFSRTKDSQGRPIFETIMPILHHGRKTGIIRMEYQISDYLASQQRTERLRAYTVAVFVIFAIVSALLTSWWVAAPLSSLAEAARRDWDRTPERFRVNRMVSREIQSLAADFNDMAKRQMESEAELKQSESRLRELTRMIISAQEEERNRIGRELHDDFGHQFMTLALNIEALRKKNLLPEGEMESLANLVRNISDSLMGIYRGLKPTLIDRLGLAAAIQSQIREIEAQGSLKLKRRIAPIDSGDISYETALGIYRIFQEAMSNIIKHADATEAEIILEKAEGGIRLAIEDNGYGMDMGERKQHDGIGLVGMGERAASLGARLDIKSSPGAGTSLTLFVPGQAMKNRQNGEEL